MIDQLKSAIITVLFSGALFLFIFYFKFVREIPKQPQINTMLIHFGEQHNGRSSAELSKTEINTAKSDIYIPEEFKTPAEALVTAEQPQEQPLEKGLSNASDKKAINEPVKTAKIDVKNTVSDKSDQKSGKEKQNASKKTDVKAENSTKTALKSSEKQTKGDIKDKAQISSSDKNKASKKESLSEKDTKESKKNITETNPKGKSKIGVDRKLIAWIPGVMGKGRAKPPHNCSVKGAITISYTVDKTGSVVSAFRSSGITDPCAVTAAVIWVKKYVKAEKSTTNSTGTYIITF